MIWRASSLTWELFVLECLQRASGSKTSNLSIYLHRLVSSVTIINESCTCGCWEDVVFIEQVSFFKSWCLFLFSEMCFSGGKQMSRSHESRFNITAWTWPDLHCDELPAHRRFITLSSQLPAKTLQRLMTQTKIGLFVAAGAIQEKSKYTLQFCEDPQHMHQRTGGWTSVQGHWSPHRGFLLCCEQLLNRKQEVQWSVYCHYEKLLCEDSWCVVIVVNFIVRQLQISR